MKIVKKIALIGSALFVIGLVIAMIASVTMQRPFFDVISHTNHHKIDGATISDEKIDEIVIDFDVAEVNIKASSDSKISYEYFGNENNNFETGTDDNKLKFSDSHRRKFFNFGFRTNRLELYLPSEKSYNIRVSSDVGSINIADIKAKDINARSNVGAIDIKNVTVTGEMIAKSDIGEVKIRDVKEPTRLEASSNIGAVKIINLYSKDVTLSSDIGEVKFENDDLSYKIDRLNVNTNIGSQTINVGR